MFFPFRDENELELGDPPSYANKRSQPGVIDIVNENKASIEPYAELVDDALAQYNFDSSLFNTDPFAEQENDETLSHLRDSNDGKESDRNERNVTDFNESIPISNIYFNDKEVNDLIRLLNEKERQLFEYIFHCAKSTVKERSSNSAKKISPFHLFLTGGGGCGKSHLIKTIFQAVSKIFLYHDVSLEKPRVMLLAPNGVASININGTTLHSAFGLPCGEHFTL